MEGALEPLLSNQNTKAKGGLRTMPFIIANEAFERVASYGLQANMIFYLKSEYDMETRRATNLILIWSAASSILPVIGAIVADSYVGRYSIIGFGSIASLLGTILLWLTTIFEGGKPTTIQYMLLYASVGLMSIGAGGIRASSIAFGADQLIKKGDNLKNAGVLQSYFGWYNVACAVSYIVSVSCIVYIQDQFGWTVGFGVPVVLMLLSAVSFFLASPIYVKEKPNSNLLIGLAQVVVASYKNRHISLSSEATYEMYHRRKESTVLMPSEKLRFLNKACIIRNPEKDLTPDGKASNPWSLCTIDQVEELKALINVIPIWSTGIIFSVNISQFALGAIQAKTIDRHITRNLEIPAGSLGLFLMGALTLWIAFYDRILVPLASKLRGQPSYLSTKLRMGIGLLLSVTSLASWAIVESIRRELAVKEGFSDDPTGVVDMSVMWLFPHLIMDGLAEAFYTVAANEFFYCEFPKSMSSISSGLSGVAVSVANVLASVILNAVDYVSKLGGGESWVSNNINKGHYDYYFWFLACLCLVNFLYYLICSKAYGPCRSVVNNVYNEHKSSRQQC
ncbi:hypothetical protein JRO89_XS03G0271000 [Xanthoceras sorbifolium]|uniref:Protein NRT1/ PTR FAMILY 1.2-like n=1 Tax=Xanthoceras sorbifolium TaxID=99658 RepID=A0ABQ8IC72_9ROSI|nr:hypothetical protein JRO89_XS03G0271000 [Xanthoceras sorbifolium]